MQKCWETIGYQFIPSKKETDIHFLVYHALLIFSSFTRSASQNKFYETSIFIEVSGFLAILFLLLQQLPGAAQTGNALLFNKALKQYIAVPHSASINLGSTFTIEANVYYNGSDVTIVDKGDYDFLVSLNPRNGQNKIGVYQKSNNTWYYSTAAVTQNQNTHVAVVYNNGTVYFYINGEDAGIVSNAFFPAQDNQPMNIGRQQPTACQCNHFSGVMDELRLWNVARSQVEIQANMNGEVPANSPGLGAYYKFNEGSGTTVNDATGNGNTGQMQGALQWVAASKNYPAYYGPGTWTYLVPNGVGFLKYQAWGAGASGSANCNGFSGGGGAYAQSKFVPVTTGQRIYLYTGAAIAAGAGAGIESSVSIGNNDYRLRRAGQVRYGGAASNTGTSPDLDFSFKGGDAGNNITYNNTDLGYPNFTTYGGAGAAASPNGPGANGANATTSTYGSSGGFGNGDISGNGGIGASSNSCDQSLFATAAQNGTKVGGGGGAPWNSTPTGIGTGGLIIVDPCPTTGSIASHTVPFPAELTADTIKSIELDGFGATNNYTWQYSTNGSTWTTAPGNVTTAYYPLPAPNNPPNIAYYRRLTISGCASASNVATITTFSAANGLLKGTINGRVTSVNGTGVADITITAKKTVNLLGSPVTKTYTTITNPSGNYSLQNLFYGEPSEGDTSIVDFVVTPSRGIHEFNPVRLTASLSKTNFTANTIDFVDNTVYSVTGKVTQTCIGCEVGFTTDDLDSVRINAIKTAGNVAAGQALTGSNGYGSFGITLTDPGAYRFVPTRPYHSFSPVDTTITIVNNDLLDVNFRDNSYHTISGIFKAAAIKHWYCPTGIYRYRSGHSHS